MKKQAFIAAAVLAASVIAPAHADGQKTYTKACFACHGTGAAGAPKLGDKAAWKARIAKGKKSLYDIALKGKPGTAMLAKGGHAELSDADVKAAVDYMVEKSK